jgi:hypothetical protein
MSRSQTNDLDPANDLDLHEGENDLYAVVERAAEIVWQRTQQAVERGEVTRISDAAIVNLLTAAVKLYAHKAANEKTPFRPIHGRSDEVVTATEALTTALEVLRALHLGPMEFGLWSHRKPEHYSYLENEALNAQRAAPDKSGDKE